MAIIKLSKEELSKLKQIELGAVLEIDRICRKHNIKYTIMYGTLLGAARHKGFIPWDDDLDIGLFRDDYEKLKEVCQKELSSKYFYQSHDTDSNYYHLFDKIRVNGTIFKEDLLAHHDIHHGVYIDVFPFDKIPNNIFLRKKQILEFHFYRTGLMVKFMSMNHRTGIKAIIARVLYLLYMPFSLDFLYNKAHKVAKRYNKADFDKVFNFCDSILLDSTCKYESIKNVCDIEFEKQSLMAFKDYEDVLKTLYGDYMTLPPEEDREPHHHLEDLKI